MAQESPLQNIEALMESAISPEEAAMNSKAARAELLKEVKENLSTYVVEKGDSLNKIAKALKKAGHFPKFLIQDIIEGIATLNNLNLSKLTAKEETIYPGQKLLIPHKLAVDEDQVALANKTKRELPMEEIPTITKNKSKHSPTPKIAKTTSKTTPPPEESQNLQTALLDVATNTDEQKVIASLIEEYGEQGQRYPDKLLRTNWNSFSYLLDQQFDAGFAERYPTYGDYLKIGFRERLHHLSMVKKVLNESEYTNTPLLANGLFEATDQLALNQTLGRTNISVIHHRPQEVTINEDTDEVESTVPLYVGAPKEFEIIITDPRTGDIRDKVQLKEQIPGLNTQTGSVESKDVFVTSGNGVFYGQLLTDPKLGHSIAAAGIIIDFYSDTEYTIKHVGKRTVFDRNGNKLIYLGQLHNNEPDGEGIVFNTKTGKKERVICHQGMIIETYNKATDTFE